MLLEIRHHIYGQRNYKDHLLQGVGEISQQFLIDGCSLIIGASSTIFLLKIAASLFNGKSAQGMTAPDSGSMCFCAHMSSKRKERLGRVNTSIH